MPNIRIPTTSQVYSVDTKLDLKPGQEVLVEISGIQEPGIFCDINCAREIDGKENIEVIRPMGEEDFSKKKILKEKAVSYIDEAREKAFRHGLDLKILDADLSFDEKKLTFYFSCEGRVDFRSLAADMIGSFGKMIRLQQVGPRDQAKIFGGLGKCGRELCCSRFLNNLDSVSLEMAENQDAGGGKGNKLVGCCGKLMCCLSYENNLYEEKKQKMPKIGSAFKNKQVEGIVIGHNILESKIIIENSKKEKVEVVI